MSISEMLVRKLDTLNGKAHYFAALIALLGTLLVGSSIIAWQSSRQQQSIATVYRQTQVVLCATQEVKLATRDALRGERGYLLTGDVTYLKRFAKGRSDLTRSLDVLRSAARGAEDSVDAVDELHVAASDYLEELATVVALARSGDQARAIAMVRLAGTADGLATVDKNADGIIEVARTRMRSIASHGRRVTDVLLHFIYLMSAIGLGLLLLAIFAAAALRRSFSRERIYRDELQKRANTDELTGVANRRQLLSVLELRIAEARANGTPLSFAMFDLDNFKSVNDTYGHAVGDRAICHVVRTALRMVRLNDVIGRLGGEEFGIILPKAEQDNAFVVCERLRKHLREESMPIEGHTPLSMTISSGIACLTDEDDANSLMERADKALYAAKRDGRDQVRLAA